MQWKYEIIEEDGVFGIKEVYFDDEEESFKETENFRNDVKRYKND